MRAASAFFFAAALLSCGDTANSFFSPESVALDRIPPSAGLYRPAPGIVEPILSLTPVIDMSEGIAISHDGTFFLGNAGSRETGGSRRSSRSRPAGAYRRSQRWIRALRPDMILAFGTGSGNRQSIYVVNSDLFGDEVPGAGPGIVRVGVGVPGLTTH